MTTNELADALNEVRTRLRDLWWAISDTDEEIDPQREAEVRHLALWVQDLEQGLERDGVID